MRLKIIVLKIVLEGLKSFCRMKIQALSSHCVGLCVLNSRCLTSASGGRCLRTEKVGFFDIGWGRKVSDGERSQPATDVVGNFLDLAGFHTK